ncbi:sigma-54 dependent transcriptional regulator [Desulfobacula sp.]|uniref:sigma-54-dependent transcriptional regulator n=1 Tax=Desulfobacula sp. TaxID=2593537 RepID=UPI00262EB0EF|nr:sigma-54 dependent transcriptional regulator [Desulfobacula sp.]
MIKVLIIDDDPKICLFFSQLLKQMGHEPYVANTLKKGLDLNTESCFDLILLDLELPDGNGLEIMPDLMKAPSGPEVIIITGTGDIRGAEMAFKYGAWDYVQKPFLLDEVSLPITRALQYRREKQTSSPPVPLIRSNIVGESDALRKCLENVARAAVTDASILITGETGTGKELFARAIHENSKRNTKPFIAVDCGALPETLVESTLFGHEKGAFTGANNRQDGLIAQADGGTLLLDEVGDLPLNIQKTFLRTLQERYVRRIGGKSEKRVDFRLVAATNLNLDEMVKKNTFREDLLYRIRAMEIQLPPLRERGQQDIEDITIKKTHVLAQRYGIETKAISPEFFQTLAAHHWPGNVRELMNVLEYVLASAGQDPTLFPKHLPPEYRAARLAFDPVSGTNPRPQTVESLDAGDDLPTLQAYRNQIEKTYLKILLRRAKGNREAASRISGVSQSRLYSLLKKHHLSGFSAS